MLAEQGGNFFAPVAGKALFAALAKGLNDVK
jgi:hypothetical protein